MKNSFLEAKSRNLETVYLISEYNGLSISLLEKLLANFFRVKIICVNKDLWLKKASYLQDNRFLSFGKTGEVQNDADYLVFVSAFFDNLEKKNIREILSNENLKLESSISLIKVVKKRFFILPYSIFENLGRELINLYSLNVKNKEGLLKNVVIYLDNLLGPRIILNSRDEMLISLKGLIEEKKVEIPNLSSKIIRPTPVGEAARKIVELLTKNQDLYFRILICGRKISFKNWIKMLKVGFGNLDYYLSKEKVNKLSGIVDKEIFIEKEVNLRFLHQTVNWFKNNKDDFYYERDSLVEGGTRTDVILKKSFSNLKLGEKISRCENKLLEFFRRGKLGAVNRGVNKKGSFIFNIKVKFRDIRTPRIGVVDREHSGLQKYLLFIISALATLILVPVVSLVASFIFLYLGQKALRNSRFDYAKYLFVFQNKTADFSLPQFYFYSNVPFLGKYFADFGQLADIASQTAEIASTAIDAGQKTFSLIGKTINGQEAPLDSYSKEIVLSLDSIYQKVSFLEGELNDLKNDWPFNYLSFYVDRIDLPRRREEIQAAKTTFSLIGKVLGEDREKNYLVLLQNNMELRPTGGFIGSFAIVGFKKGAMTKFEVYDVYSADGQLKGYVEPPWQLKKYLNQPAWYLRDSNWDPDFVVSAQKAEWFLDKSMNTQVDGVIGIDLYFVQDLVKLFGSVYVSDFDKRIDAKNFYEVVQYEAEKNFFPGSRQKENFLLSLSRSLLSSFKSASRTQMLNFLRDSYKDLDERHIQVFLHEAQIQEKIDNLGWGGEVRLPLCSSDNCFSDIVSLVEANLGVNKANYFINREVKIRVDITNKTIIRNLEVSFSNAAQVFMGDKAKYQNYLRLILPGDVKVESVEIEQNGNFSKVDFDQEMIGGNKEVGLFFELLPTETKKIVFRWSGEGELNLDRNGEYKFYFRKQAGIESLPFSLEVNFPKGFTVGGNYLLQLTRDSKFVYNQPNLRKDFLTRFYW